MAEIVIVVGHPRSSTYCEALAAAYRRGAEAGGHRARVIALSRMRFDPILHEGFSGQQPLEPDLAEAQRAIGAADHLVIVFPLWYGCLPALLKGFIERVFQPGFATEKAKTAMGFRPLLTGKSARVIVTMGMPGFVYRWYFGAHALKMLKRNILGFVGFSPIRDLVLGRIDAVSAERRQLWLAEVEELGRLAR